jgi:hypothetical protein
MDNPEFQESLPETTMGLRYIRKSETVIINKEVRCRELGFGCTQISNLQILTSGQSPASVLRNFMYLSNSFQNLHTDRQ